MVNDSKDYFGSITDEEVKNLTEQFFYDTGLSFKDDYNSYFRYTDEQLELQYELNRISF